MAEPRYKSSLNDRELSEAEQARFVVRPALLARLESFRRARGIEKRELRILDWGCGRGMTVFGLRDLGYDACGVEIDPEPVESGRALARSRGLDGDEILSVLDARGRSQHPDARFDFSCSISVFEHVRDIDAVARELARITAPAGSGLHTFPARFALVEPHLRIPLVHWLPKNRLRLAAIRAGVLLGARTRSETLCEDPSTLWSTGMSDDERLQYLYRFSCDQTFYRSLREICGAFARAGMRALPDTVHSLSVQSHPLTRPFARSALLAPLLNWALVQFLSVNLVVARNGQAV